jgi:PIN like domain
MRDVFAHFYPPEEKDIAAALQTGLVVPDTNVLLDLYRMQAEARAQLFGALEKLGTRLWIPHQVGLEFHRNRLDVIAEREKSFAKAQSEFEAAIDGLCTKVRAFHSTRFAAVGSVVRIEQALRCAQKLIAESVSDAEDCNDVRLDGAHSRPGSRPAGSPP